MRRVRRALVILLTVAVCLVLLAVATRQYLASAHALGLLTSRLQALSGGPVQVARMQIGLHHSSASEVQLYESQAEPTDPPWAVIQDMQAEMPALSLLGDEALPHTLTLRGAAVTLRFDTKGHLVTRLPLSTTAGKTLPAMHLAHGQLTLRQEGRTDMVITGIDAAIHDDDGRLVLEGKIIDPYWGVWDLQGMLDRASGSSLALKTPHVHLTQAMLDRLPFVAPKVWQQVQIEGDTPVECTFRLDPAADKVHYRVTLAPKATRVHVTAIRLEADQARGNLVIENQIVQLRDVRGQTAGGEIETNGDLNFRDAPAQLQFAIEVRRLDLARLPKSWSLPSQIQGRLTGQANLRVTIVDGKAQTEGEGQGVINDARIAGLPAKPIHLTLNVAGSRFRFLPQEPAANSTPEARGRILNPPLYPLASH
jgi:hypothetical protein